MKTFRRLALALILAPAFNATTMAKCPTGKVTVHGRLENPPSTLAEVEATVIVESRNGTVSRTVSLSSDEFTIEVPFSTQSSSFFGSDYCHTVPRFVEVKIGSASTVYLQKRIAFKDSFQMTKPYDYRLKHELSMDGLALLTN